MENLNCFKSFDLPKRSNYDIHQMIFQHQLIMKNLAMKAFVISINWSSIEMHYKRYNYMNKMQIYHDNIAIKGFWKPWEITKSSWRQNQMITKKHCILRDVTI